MTKLTIESFGDSTCISKPLERISLLINPENYELKYKIDYENSNIIGDSAETMYFSKMGSDVLSLTKLVVDGTGIIPLERFKSVDDYIAQMSKVLYEYNGDIHRPPYIKVKWGTLTFKGVCSSFNVKYTLFTPEGNALRAMVDLTFKSSTAPVEKEKQAGKNSPDLTHIRTVKAGDTLPLMTFKIYGDSSYYLEIARINNLANINAIKPGDQIYFPPLKK